MKRYNPATPRIAFGAIAVATAALNFAVLVVLPAGVDVADADTQLAAANEAALPHTDSSRVALAADSRGRRHELIERLVANMQEAGLMRLAGPSTTRSDR